MSKVTKGFTALICFAALATQAKQFTPRPQNSEAVAVSALKIMTLSDVVRQSLSYSQELKRADSSINEAAHQLSQARSSLFPTINGVASATNKQNATSFNAGNAAGQPLTSANGTTYNLGLTLSQPLYAGGAISNGLSFYKASEDLARQSFFTSKQSVVFATLQSFFTMASLQERLEVATQNRDILKAYLEITKHYANIGRARSIDKLKADVSYSLSLATIEDTKNQLIQSQAALKRLIGIDKEIPISADFQAVINPVEKISIQEAFEEGVKNNPSVRQAQIKVEEVDYSEGLDLAADMPNLSLNGSAGYNSPDQTNLFTSAAQYYSIGLNLTVPLFTGLSSISKRHVYSDRKYQAERTLQTEKDQLRQVLESDLADLESLRGQLAIAEDSVKKARLALEMATKGYQQGIASSNDVSDMQTTRYNAETLFVNTQYRYLAALAALRQAMGVDLEKAYVR